MRAKIRNNKPYGVSLSADEKKAMDVEIRRQILQSDRDYQREVAAMYLYSLHIHEGYGAKRMRKYWETMIKLRNELIARYQMPDDSVWLYTKKLLDMGVDIEKWLDELYQSTTPESNNSNL